MSAADGPRWVTSSRTPLVSYSLTLYDRGMSLTIRGLKTLAADALMRLAYKLDPLRPNVVTNNGGGYQIRLRGLPLANISPGTAGPAINDQRPVR